MTAKNLIVICGLQGTGKTTVARRIIEKMQAVLLRTDVIRKELKNFQYTEEAKQLVYEEMFSRAKTLLQEGKNVVLDATFIRQKNRDQAQQLASEVNADFQIILVVSSDEAVKQRIKERVGDESEAGFEQYLNSKGAFETIIGKHITIDNSGLIEETNQQLDRYFQ
jgi:predicted kinase